MLGKFDLSETAPSEASAAPRECPVTTRLYVGYVLSCEVTVERTMSEALLKAVMKPWCTLTPEVPETPVEA